MGEQWNEGPTTYAQTRDDEDILDDWENALDEKPKKVEEDEKSKVPVKAPPTTKNKINKKKYAGDENLSDEEFRESLKEPDRQYTAEELEDMRKRSELRKEELKLNMAVDFIGTSEENYSLDNTNLVQKQEFLDYSFRLYNRLELLSKSEYYSEFLENLLTGLTKNMSADNVKRLSISLQKIVANKQNEEREKVKSKKNTKIQLKVENKNEFDTFMDGTTTRPAVNDDYDDDNDFM